MPLIVAAVFLQSVSVFPDYAACLTSRAETVFISCCLEFLSVFGHFLSFFSPENFCARFRFKKPYRFINRADFSFKNFNKCVGVFLVLRFDFAYASAAFLTLSQTEGAAISSLTFARISCFVIF